MTETWRNNAGIVQTCQNIDGDASYFACYVNMHTWCMGRRIASLDTYWTGMARCFFLSVWRIIMRTGVAASNLWYINFCDIFDDVFAVALSANRLVSCDLWIVDRPVTILDVPVGIFLLYVFLWYSSSWFSRYDSTLWFSRLIVSY